MYSDEKLANLLCNKDGEALKFFQKEYLDHLYRVSYTLHKPLPDDEIDYIQFSSDKKFTYRINSDVMRAYEWTIEQIILKACKYKGLSPFKNFIEKSTLTHFFKTDWIRHTKGSTQYIPDYIKSKGELFEKITLLKLKDKTKDEICRIENIDSLDYNEVINDQGVRKYLLKRDKLSDEIVLSRGQFSFREISIEKYDDDGKLLSDEVEDSDISTENKFLLSFLKDQIANTIDRIFSRDEMLLLRLYISDVFQKQDLFLFEEEGGLNKLSSHNIHSVEDFTKFYDKAFKKLLKEFRMDLRDLIVKENIKTNNLKDIHFTDGLLLTFFDEFFLDFYSS